MEKKKKKWKITFFYKREKTFLKNEFLTKSRKPEENPCKFSSPNKVKKGKRIFPCSAFEKNFFSNHFRKKKTDNADLKILKIILDTES